MNQLTNHPTSYNHRMAHYGTNTICYERQTSNYSFHLSHPLPWTQAFRDEFKRLVPGHFNLQVFKCGHGMKSFKSGIFQVEESQAGVLEDFDVQGVVCILRPISPSTYSAMKTKSMTKLFFKGFPSYATRADVQELFQQFGRVEYSYFMCDSKNGDNKYKMGYVIYDCRESVERLMAYSPYLLFQGFKISYEEYQTNKKMVGLNGKNKKLPFPSTTKTQSCHNKQLSCEIGTLRNKRSGATNGNDQHINCKLAIIKKVHDEQKSSSYGIKNISTRNIDQTRPGSELQQEIEHNWTESNLRFNYFSLNSIKRNTRFAIRLLGDGIEPLIPLF